MTMIKRTLVYTLYALLIGGIVGVIDTFFGRVLIGIGEVRTDYLLYLLPFLALAGILITYLNQTMEARVKKGWSSSLKSEREGRKTFPSV